MIKEETKDIVSFNGQIDKRYNIVVVFKAHPKYEELKSFIGDKDIAATLPDKPIIIVDGEELDNTSEDTIRFIEAHEIAHHLLKHNITWQSRQEKEADYGGYLLLRKYHFFRAADLVKKYFKIHWKVSLDEFEKTSGDQIKKRMKI